MRRWLLCAVCCVCASMFATAQQAVPELPFDSVPDFLKLPPGMNFGEVSGVAVNSKGHVFVFTRSNSAGGPAYGPAAAQLLEFGPKGEFIREIGKGIYGWSFAHTVRIDRDDNIWAVDKGSDMVIKFNQAGRITRGLRTAQGVGGSRDGPWEHSEPAAAARERPVPAADRHRLGLAGQHLHQRRLRQLARREVRPERRLGEVVGRARAAAPGSSTRPTPSPSTATTTSTWATAATGASRCSTPTARSSASSRSTCRRRPGLRARQRQHADRGRRWPTDRRAELGVHHARAEPGDVRRRDSRIRAASSR